MKYPTAPGKVIQHRWLLLLALLLAPVLGSAQSIALSLKEVESLSLNTSRGIRRAEKDVEIARLRVIDMRSNFFPTANFTFAYTHLSPIKPYKIEVPEQFSSLFPATTLQPNIQNAYAFKWQINQPIFTGFKLRAGYLATKYSEKAAQQTLVGNQVQTVYQARQAYWNLYRARELQKLLKETVEQVKAHRRDVQNFLDQSMATRNDLLKVELQLSNTELQLIEAENGVELARAALNNLLGQPLDTPIEPSSAPEFNMDLSLDAPSASRQASASRPDLQSMRFQLSAAQQNIRVAKSAFYPSLGFRANFDYMNPNQRIFPLTDKFQFTYDFGVALTWDILSWDKRIAQQRIAQKQYEQLTEGIKQLEEGVGLQVRQQVLGVKVARQKISVAEQSVRQAEENLRICNEKFKNGLLSNSELLDAESAHLLAKTNVIQAKVDYQLAVANLQQALGQ